MSRSALSTSVRRLRGLLAEQHRHEESGEQLLHAFLADRDESAFTVLVRRHGPMVHSVCRRVLGHVQDAEDAFQATFLLLARKAAALRNKAALAGWLHGTAYRTALKAKQAAARRRKHEGQTPARPSADPAAELLWREVRALLDEEIACLPEIYRSVFVLCFLESLSRAEAARRLGLKEGTVSSRLAEARKRLQQRLTRRGVELTALLAGVALATPPASALPPVLLATTTGIAPSPIVAALVDGGSAFFSAGKAELAALLLLAVGLASGAGLWVCRGPARPPAAPAQSAAKESAEKPKPRTSKQQSLTVEIRGRVLDPDGKAVRGAKLLFLYSSNQKIPSKVWAASAADGRFHFAVSKGQVGNGYSETPWENTHVMAAAEGYGFGVARLGKAEAADLTLRLVKDNVPIRGRVLDLQGQPVAGVRVRINGALFAPEKGDLTTWLASLKNYKRDLNIMLWIHLTALGSPAFDVLFPPVTTGADGRFRINGIGRERVVNLRIERPTIATQTIRAMTRPSEKITLPEERNQSKKGTVTYFGAAFDLVAAPVRPIVGVVRDKDTGKPLAGVTVESKTIAHRFGMGVLRTTTDKEGRYRLIGFAKGDSNEIAATTNDLPYLSAIRKVDNPPGLEPVAVDFALKRGVWVKGRVTEKIAGKPLPATVEYFCFWENPNAKEMAHLVHYNESFTAKDGSYRIAALPGRGLIAVRAYQDHYVMGVGAEQIKESDRGRTPGIFSTVPYSCFAGNFHTLVEISPKRDEAPIACDVTLDPGRTLRGTVFGPDDKPLAGARVSGLKDMGYWLNTGAEFRVESLRPNTPRVLQFVHEGKKLVGILVLQGDEKGPLSVRLEPFGTLTGRLVTLQGEPLAGANVTCGAVVKRRGQVLHPTALDVRTGKDGCFRIVGLKPGLKYNLGVTKASYVRDIEGGEPKDLTIKPGETKDLGDLRVKPLS